MIPDLADMVHAAVDEAAATGRGVYFELHQAAGCEAHHASLVRGASDVAEITLGIMRAKGIVIDAAGWVHHPEIVVRLFVHHN